MLTPRWVGLREARRARVLHAVLSMFLMALACEPEDRQESVTPNAVVLPAPSVMPRPNETAGSSAQNDRANERLSGLDGFIVPIPAARPGEGPLPPPDLPPGPFNRRAAAEALGGVEVASCKTLDGPTGSGHLTVWFSLDGTVSEAHVDAPPFEGTWVGKCIEARFLRARVPPYAPGPYRVGKTFVIP
jgi:hypothetical protein